MLGEGHGPLPEREVAALVRLLWAAQPDGRAGARIPSRLRGDRLPHRHRLPVSAPHRRALDDLLAGRSNRLLRSLTVAALAHDAPVRSALLRDAAAAKRLYARLRAAAPTA